MQTRTVRTAILAGPVLRGAWAPTVPILALFLVGAVSLRVTANPKVHGAAVIYNWLVVTAYIAMFAMLLGGAAVNSG